MDDLVARSNKYAISAGRTGEGQYRAAENDERLSRILSWASTALSAVVGTSISTKWFPQDALPFLGVAAIVAAALSAVQRTSKLAERAEAHRVAGAEYGRLRRRADLLKLRLEGGDIITRAKGLEELEKIGEALSELAKKTRALPESVYEPAAKKFDNTHLEYFRSTHAGGVVIRREGATIQYLVIQTQDEPRVWVLPKGHIKRGESSEQAARREVLEEAGVETAVRDVLDTIEFSTPKERVKAQFFLMEAVKEGPPREGRQRQWLNFDEAMHRLEFKEAQRLLCQAQALLQRPTESIENSPRV